VPISHNRAIHIDTGALEADRLLFEEISRGAWPVGANCLRAGDIASGSPVLVLGTPHVRPRAQGRGQHDAGKDVSRVSHARGFCQSLEAFSGAVERDADGAHLQITKGASMLRASMFAPMVVGFTTSVAVCAEDARQLTCEGTMIEPAATSQTTETVKLTLGRAQNVTLDLGEGAISARVLSNNKIQLKFRTKNFEGEYFHYTGDLFFIYKSGHLMRLTCKAG